MDQKKLNEIKARHEATVRTWGIVYRDDPEQVAKTAHADRAWLIEALDGVTSALREVR